ncbi:HD domain-containing protein [Saprospiraceae bacterium]|nr:HD domain-containing protein [Saprospiraceae bacterium]
MERYKRIRDEILHKLGTELDLRLYYHNVLHTIDVINQVTLACKRHSFDDRTSILLRLAALGHDIGYLNTYENHEEEGAELMEKIMIKENYTLEDITFVKKLILATNINHQASNIFEFIIQDADLDYLGRDDFHFISEKLYKEWLAYHIIEDDKKNFDQRQLKFLKNHQYFTPYSKKHREPEKQKRIAELEMINK